jgi:phosphoglycolate phosphatase-like HAD superfamily hydrolase
LHVVLLDIDGTLTQSQSVDSDVYLRTLKALFDFERVRSDWGSYTHMTDRGILHEVFADHRGTPPAASDMERFRAYFVAEIEAWAAKEPFREVPGAASMLRHVAALPDHFIGLATGGWHASARVKCVSAGVDFDTFPVASSDDAMSRTDIMTLSLERVLASAGRPRADLASLVYVGDGVWDARACRKLGVPFIGIATGEDAVRLAAEGAITVLPDYSDLRAVREAIAAAQASRVANLGR